MKNHEDRTLYSYIDKDIKSPWWNYIIKSPFLLIDLFQKEADEDVNIVNYYNLSREQDENVDLFKSRISISIDKQTGMISAGVTLQDPALSALVADSIVSRLINYVTDYRTNKAVQDLDFAMKIFYESQQKYYEAQRAYANYVDKNKNLVLESVQVERERLRNEQSLAFDVYTSLAQQVEQAKMKVQEETPCVTVIEPARVPAKKSNVSKLVILLMFSIMGGVVSVILLFFSKRKEIIVN